MGVFCLFFEQFGEIFNSGHYSQYCKKHDINTQEDSNVSGNDAFTCLYSAVESDIEAPLQKVGTVSKEKSKASAVGIDAKIHQTKVWCLMRFPDYRDWLLRRQCDGLDKMDTSGYKEKVSIRFLSFLKFGS